MVTGNYVHFSVWIYHPMGQEKLDCSGFSLRGCAPRDLARLEQIQALHGKTLASPLQRSIQLLPASFPVGWSVPACANTCAICASSLASQTQWQGCTN